MAAPIAINKTYGVAPGLNRFGMSFAFTGAGAIGALGITGYAGPMQRGQALQGAIGPLSITGYAGALETGMPAWYEAQAVSTWVAIGSNTIADVQPNYDPPPGLGARRMIIDAWSGGALVYRNGRPNLAVFGGGHADYWGNEIPAIDLLADAPAWDLAAPCSAKADCIWEDPDGIYPDGRPSSVHSYGTLDYSHDLNELLAFGLSACWSGPAFSFNYLFGCNMQTGAWTHRGNLPSGVQSSGIVARHPSSGAGATEELWYHGGARSNLCAYHPATTTWRGPYGTGDFELDFQGVAAIDPARNKMLKIGNVTGLREWNLAAPGDPIAPATTGNAIETAYKPGFCYVPPPFDRFIAWDGGQPLHILDHTVTPYAWSSLSVGGATPSAPNADYQGTFGRFRYVPQLHGLVVVNKTAAQVYFFKLPATP